MTITVTLLILLAAMMHATWNAFIKRAPDKVAMSTLVYSAGMIVAIPGIFIFPLPSPEVWKLVAIHAGCHVVYKLAMIAMYEKGDLSQVYPATRGVAPLMTTLIAIPMIGEVPSAQGMIGIGLVCAGLLIFVVEPGVLSREGAKPLVIAAIAGLAMSVYTIADAIAVRNETYRFSFIAWIFLFDALSMFALAFWRRGRALGGLLAAQWKVGLTCGTAAFLNFGVILWALTLANVGNVAALRETSVVFAALIGTLFMGESFGRRRVFAASVVAFGIIVMNWVV
jgi:drug/metabolite transporter (DMT)-like permease